MTHIKSIFNILLRHHSVVLFLLLSMMFFASFLELSALILFAFQVSALGNIGEDVNNSNFQFLHDFVSLYGFDTSFIVFLTVILIALCARASTVFFINTFSQNARALISKDEFDFFGSQNLNSLKAKDLSSFSSDILSEVDVFIQSGLLPTLKLINSLILIIVLVAGIVFIGGDSVIFGYLFYFAVYIFLYLLTNNFVKKFGEIRKQKNQERYLVTSDAFRNFKYLKFANLMGTFSDKLLEVAKRMGKAQALTNSIADFPRIFLESITFLIILVIFYLTNSSNGQSSIYFETIFLFGASALRFLPSMQLIYASSTSIKSISPTISAIHHRSTKNTIKNFKKIEKLPKSIEINDLNFSYGSNQVFNNFCKSINLNKFTLLKGKSGSGKSTLIDLILGFQACKENAVSWGKISIKDPSQLSELVSYIPQEPTIFDGSVKKNLILNNEYDESVIEEIFLISGLDTFLSLEDFNNPDFRIDILSGGQKQRIGIARALYNKPKYLIIDEGMSGLDKNSTIHIFEKIRNLKYIKGLLIISHNEELDYLFDEILNID